MVSGLVGVDTSNVGRDGVLRRFGIKLIRFMLWGAVGGGIAPSCGGLLVDVEVGGMWSMGVG